MFTVSNKQILGKYDTLKVDLSRKVEYAELRDKLTSHLGVKPGPITATTYQVYLLYLQNLESQVHLKKHQKKAEKNASTKVTSANSAVRSDPSSSDKTNEHLPKVNAESKPQSATSETPNSGCPEEIYKNIEYYKTLELKAFKDFIPTKEFFNYLLIDPRIPKESPILSEQWKCFLSAIFYIGKGQTLRPYDHLREALKLWDSERMTTTSRKCQHILDIWKAKYGIIVLRVFRDRLAEEAHTREAAMIEALGRKKLSNCKNGTYYGVVSTWTSKEKCDLGMYLLYEAFQEFLRKKQKPVFPDRLQKL